VKKLVLVWVMCATSVFAVDMKLLPSDSSKSISGLEVNAMKKHLMDTMHFKPNSDDDVKRIVRENKMLANAYLQEHGQNKFTMELLEIELNEKLSDRYVKELYGKTVLDDDVVRSYYLEHQDKFKKPPFLKSKILIFNDLDKAIEFYNQAKKDGSEKAIAFAENNDSAIKVVKYYVPTTLAKPQIRALLQPDKKSYFTPPQYINGHFVMAYIEEVLEERGYREYEKVKPAIEKELKDKTFRRKREEIISQMEKQ
jgi:hypothetical protein